MRTWIVGLGALALLGCSGGEGNTGLGKDIAGGDDLSADGTGASDQGGGDALADVASQQDVATADLGGEATNLPDKSSELADVDAWSDLPGPIDVVTGPDAVVDAQTDVLADLPADVPADVLQPPEDVPQQDADKDTGAVDSYPIPDPGEELPAPCQAALDDPYYFQFLDNLCDEKVWPTDQDRDRQCPVSDDSPFMTLKDGTVVEYEPADAPVVFDTQALNGLTPAGMEIAVILVKRVGGIPYFRYISNGKHDIAMQPWSTTKFLAAANAAATLRTKSNYNVGLTASVKNIPVGDLVTSVCNYDYSPYSSNALGAWFHDV
ncbi:MAG: hypothetical protein FJ109_09130, partial [Deltaproteobacteria bacterium]|nr:hypothetical protein [Deltaproteobacteria bacterium]